jgi:hypothetical protein
MENYAAHLIEKINSPFDKHSDRQSKQLNKQISNEI